MEKAKVLIEELKTLVGKTDSVSEQRRNKIGAWFRDNSTEEESKLYYKFLKEGLDNLQSEMLDIEKCINEERDKKAHM